MSGEIKTPNNRFEIYLLNKAFPQINKKNEVFGYRLENELTTYLLLKLSETLPEVEFHPISNPDSAYGGWTIIETTVGTDLKDASNHSFNFDTGSFIDLAVKEITNEVVYARTPKAVSQSKGWFKRSKPEPTEEYRHVIQMGRDKRHICRFAPCRAVFALNPLVQVYRNYNAMSIEYGVQFKCLFEK